MSRLRRACVAYCAALLVVFATGCERESRSFEPPAPRARVAAGTPATFVSYDDNAFALASGKRLFDWYNCSGCHAQGGGGMGPPLMDDIWIYGSSPQTIYQTIVDGRPNGMPAFGTRIPQDQVWQLVAYVRSLAGLASQQAAPNRADAMHARKPESEMDSQKPVNVSSPTR